MMDFCVCCGSTIPEGRQVCATCEKGEQIKLDSFAKCVCHECGAPLEIWHKKLIHWAAPQNGNSFPYEKIDLIYHCDHCGCDYTSEFESDFGVLSQTPLKRKFWG